MKNLIDQLKSVSVKFEQCKWSNLNGKEQTQMVMIFTPENKSKIHTLLESKTTVTGKNTYEDEDQKQRFHFDSAVWKNVTISSKRSYKSYSALLDAPSIERLNHLKTRLKKAQDNKLSGVPPAMVEQQIKKESKRTLRSIIEASLEKEPSKITDAFRERLNNAEKCLVTNYLKSHESLWACLRPINAKSKQVRLAVGINIFFSHQDSSRESAKIGKVVENAMKNGWVFKDWVLL